MYNGKVDKETKKDEEDHLNLSTKFILNALKKSLIIILFIACAQLTWAQDAQFSQFYSAPLYLGPSFAGAVDGSRVCANYRKQWVGFGSPFQAYSVSYDHYFSSFNSGLGVFMLSDVAGSAELGTKTLSVQYSYNITLFNIWHLRPGLSFAYVEHGLHGELLSFSILQRRYTPSTSAGTDLAPDLRTSKDIDAGVSLLIYSHDVWLGATVDHLLQPDVTLHNVSASIPLKTQVYGGWTFRKKGKLLKPSEDAMTVGFIYKNQGNIEQLDIGTYWSNDPLVLGIWYRGIPVLNSDWGDAVVFLAGIKTRNFNIGYSYDFTISRLLLHSRGSHEISLAYKFLLPKRKRKDAVPCPEF
ncbi:MAG: PorP/SprF family type IX secretion system membrane protein [Bacteroidales bacterium]|nr:PorP/SprF family type IX secretion system membrane protein [Bacteroidales bacterium]